MFSKFYVFNLILLTGSACSLIGYFFHKALVERNLSDLIENNPYAFYIERKIKESLEGNLDDLTNKKASKLRELMKYGFPGLDDIHVYEDFVLSYDRKNRVAHWVCEHLSKKNISGNIRRQGTRFLPDMTVPSNFRVKDEDFRNSGYDKGHLAAAANHKADQRHFNETFVMTNIAPQVGKGFNRHIWNKLETCVRGLADRYGSVYVYTGPMFLPKTQPNNKLGVEYEVIGPSAVAVPTHYFKVIIVESMLPGAKPYMEAYVLPNKPIGSNNLSSFLCEIGFIERVCGLHFFDGLRRSHFCSANLSIASRSRSRSRVRFAEAENFIPDDL